MKTLNPNRKHPDAQAWDKWIKSTEGKRCLEGAAEGEYLKNRLCWAFMAGRNK